LGAEKDFEQLPTKDQEILSFLDWPPWIRQILTEKELVGWVVWNFFALRGPHFRWLLWGKRLFSKLSS
jgi:hypothetical protein